MEQLAPHEKVFVDPQALAEDENHGEIPCYECHGGDPSQEDWVLAHKGVRRDPSYPPDSNVCAECHDQAEHYGSSLHVTLEPFVLMTEMRRSDEPETAARTDMARRDHCQSCHSSCGQCHVSRPSSVEGGLLNGHRFLKSPPTRNVCTACHGSRVEKEYFGKNEGSLPDVHQQRHMRCVDCHTGEEMHGNGQRPENRYDVRNAPRCETCHADIFDTDAPNAEQHVMHRDALSCHGCHAMPYKQCANCHVARDENGAKYFKTEKSWLDLRIGRNPLQSEDRPQAFVTLRHVPIAWDTYGFYVEDGLLNMNSLPTWKLATPHTIRRKTPQNSECGNCHGNAQYFLTKRYLLPGLVDANDGVVVGPEHLPASVAEEGGP